MTEKITVGTTINNATVDQVWTVYTDPSHIVEWNAPSPDWHTVKADNDVRVGGRFDSRMEAKDGSAGFNFTGTYDEVVPNERIAYTMDDGRKAEISLSGTDGAVEVSVAFDPENENPVEFQKAGWQAILDNFKKYTEDITEDLS